MMRDDIIVSALLIALCAGCGNGAGTGTGAQDGGVPADVLVSQDAFPAGHDGGTDAQAPDAGVVDSGEVDAGAADGGTPDDAGFDAAIADTGAGDGAVGDAGTEDVSGGDVEADASIEDAGFDAGPPWDAGDITDALQVRIVAGNLSSGNYQSYDPGDGIDLLKAVQPDIALVQEMNYKGNTPEAYMEFAEAIVGSDYYAVDDAAFQLPNGILSKWAITSSGWWDDPGLSNRELLWATIDIPGPVDIFAVSVHLHTSPGSDQVKAAQVIADGVAAHKAQNPGMFYYVVGGDFNGTTSVSSNGFGRNGSFHVAGPHPADDDGNENTNANRSSQYDYVLGDGALHDFQVPVVYRSHTNSSARTYNAGLVFDTRTFTQAILDEYFPPAQTGDSNAANMQHMAIVKDYYIR